MRRLPRAVTGRYLPAMTERADGQGEPLHRRTWRTVARLIVGVLLAVAAVGQVAAIPAEGWWHGVAAAVLSVLAVLTLRTRGRSGLAPGVSRLAWGLILVGVGVASLAIGSVLGLSHVEPGPNALFAPPGTDCGTAASPHDFLQAGSDAQTQMNNVIIGLEVADDCRVAIEFRQGRSLFFLQLGILACVGGTIMTVQYFARRAD